MLPWGVLVCISLVLQVCPYLVCLSVYFWLYIPCLFNKFKVPVQGCTEIPGGECHRLEIWVMENTTGFLHSGRKTVGRDAGVGAGKFSVIPLCMCSAFPT